MGRRFDCRKFGAGQRSVKRGSCCQQSRSQLPLYTLYPRSLGAPPLLDTTFTVEWLACSRRNGCMMIPILRSGTLSERSGPPWFHAAK
jgi:hypothetical protein